MSSFFAVDYCKNTEDILQCKKRIAGRNCMIKIKGVNRAVRLLALGAIILVLSFPCTGLAFAEGTGRIELVGGGVIDWPCGMPFTDPGWEAVDANGQDCRGSVESGGELCVWKLGSYTLSYSFTDIDGQPVFRVDK